MAACNTDRCKQCGHGASDLQLSCGCNLHVRCLPLNFVISEHSPIVNGEYVGIPRPQQQPRACPYCRGTVSGMKLMPLVLEDLERAVELRKQSVHLQQQQQVEQPCNQNGKRTRQDESQYLAVEAESSFLLVSNMMLTSGNSGSADRHRTGRWSPEEVQFVDYMISAFDQGTLAIPHGVKLNDLLGELLMCKSSRLTKKMKNAKLSTRSYILKAPSSLQQQSLHCAATLSSLQECFLESISLESLQLELRFHMAKLWRTHFSNLCLQIGYELLDAQEWITTLEQLEGRASEAEDHIRKARRRRMSLALKTDIGEAANAGVFIGGMSARDANMQPPATVSNANASTRTNMSSMESSNNNGTTTTTSTRTMLRRGSSEVSMSDSDAATRAQAEEDDEFLAALEMTASGGHSSHRSRLASEDMDFAALLADEVDPLSMMPHLEESLNDTPSASGGPFLEQVGAYMESHDIPFQYADVWVPSFMGEDGQATSATSDPSKLRLFPAGHATRSDMDPTVRSQLNEFGSYSAHFSFEPGHGLPGRVYSNGTPSWETNIHETDPSVFERAGGANVYGIKTAVGVPLVATGIGRIVVALYSTSDIACDQVMLSKFVEDFKAWNPEPKWKLVIDLGNSSKTNKQVTEAVVPTEMMHYSHPQASNGDSKLPPVASLSYLGSSTSTSAFESTTVTPPTTSATTATTMVYHSHAPVKPAPESTVAAGAAAAATRAPSSRTSSMDSTFDNDGTEQAIASLLGDYMPSNDGPAAALLPHFMSLRLMLLRPSERRSPEENDKLDVLKRSYVDYSKGRSGYELACLLAKDWMFLQPNFGETALSPPQSLATTSTLPQPQQPVPLPAYSLPPAASAQPTAMRMIVHKHSPPTSSSNNCAAPRSRSVSASSESSSTATHVLSADIVPDGF